MKKEKVFDQSKILECVKVDVDVENINKVIEENIKLDRHLYEIRETSIVLEKDKKTGFTEISLPFNESNEREDICLSRFIYINCNDVISMNIPIQGEVFLDINKNTLYKLNDLIFSVIQMKLGDGKYIFKGEKNTKRIRNRNRIIKIFDIYKTKVKLTF
jgi:hypothetical protein